MRFNPVPRATRGESESRFQRWRFKTLKILGRCPRLEVNNAPLALRFLIQIIALDVENSIPTGAIIFERDLPAQLHQLFFGKLVAQTLIQIIGDIRRRVCHGVSQFYDQSLDVIERRHVVVDNGAQFFIAQACFSVHGRVDVYLEWATDARRGPNFSQLNVAQ